MRPLTMRQQLNIQVLLAICGVSAATLWTASARWVYGQTFETGVLLPHWQRAMLVCGRLPMILNVWIGATT